MKRLRYSLDVTLTRRSVLTALSAAAAAQAQQRRPPNWKPRLGVLAQYSDSNLEFIKGEGFTSIDDEVATFKAGQMVRWPA